MGEPARNIYIAAALIDDDVGRLLLVRKAGTQWFMQASCKIESGENPLVALKRELNEEIGLLLTGEAYQYLGSFSSPAANEPGYRVVAEVFHIRAQHVPEVRNEIEEAIWVSHAEALDLPLAPLTRDHILPLSQALLDGRTTRLRRPN